MTINKPFQRLIEQKHDTVPVFSTWHRNSPEPLPEKKSLLATAWLDAPTQPAAAVEAARNLRPPDRPSPAHRSGELPRAPELSTSARAPRDPEPTSPAAARAPPHHPSCCPNLPERRSFPARRLYISRRRPASSQQHKEQIINRSIRKRTGSEEQLSISKSRSGIRPASKFLA